MQANEGIKVNREYKDRLFRMIFGAEENKHYLLSLYNAINHTSYTKKEDIEITTLEDVIYVKMKNDVSFLLDSQLSLYEHQSSYNPNMPLRGMMYFSHLYLQILSKQKRDIYSNSLVKIPTPRYIVFYNGDEKEEEYIELKLSDAFEKEDKTGRFEWTASMLNINFGKNQELLGKCKALYEYASYVEKVKKYKKKMSLREAVDKAVNEAIEENYLDGFFRTHKEGVIDVSLTEYNEAEFIENRREEGRKEGRKEGEKEGLAKGKKEGLAKGKKEGLAKGKLELITNMLQNGYSYEQISTMINMTVNEMKELEEQVMVK